MATLAELIVKIGADITDYEKKMKDTLKSYRKVADGFSQVGKTLTVGVTLPLMAVGTAATKMAMEAVESDNLFQVAMGDMADSARGWSEQLRKQLGLNSYELRRNVGVFYAMFSSMGLGEKSAYDLSTGLTKLAYDMASFYNLNPDEAFEKLRSGIVGEVEPLRSLGIIVDEATVKAYAYKTGIAKQGSELTAQQKILARYGVIMAQTGQAQGDLARTIDSPTNRLRVLSAQLQEVATKFGMSLLPSLQSLLTAAVPFVEFLGKMADGFNKLNPHVRNAVVDFVALLAIVGPTLWALGGMVGSIAKLVPLANAAAKAIKTMTAAQVGLNVAMDANVIGIIVVGLAAISSGAWWVAKNIDTVQLLFIDAWGRIKRAVFDAGVLILAVFKAIMEPIPWVANRVDALLQKVSNLQQAEIATENRRQAAVQATMGAVVAGERYQAMVDKAAESTKAWDQGLGDTAGTMAKAVTATDILSYKLDRLQKAWQLFTITTTLSESSREYLLKQQENLQAQLGLVTDQLKLTEEAYTKSVSTTGLWSAATIDLGKALDDLRIKQAELQKQIEDTTKAAQHQGDIMRKDGAAYVNVGGAWVDVNALGGGPQRDQAEVEAIARRQGVDLSTAAAMYDENQRSGIKKYHSGGIFAAPPGRSEGLALLKDGETILPTGAAAGVNIQKIEVIIHEATDAQRVARIARQAITEGIRDAVRQGA